MLSQRKAYLLWSIRDDGKLTRDLSVARKEFDNDYSTVSNLCQLFFPNLCNPTSPAEVIELIKTFTHINIYVGLVRFISHYQSIITVLATK